MPGIFICYRRADSAGRAGRIYDRLVGHFGDSSVFMDIDAIEPGENWIEAIEKTVGNCDALIAVIGPAWLSTKKAGRRRIDVPDDRLRLELETALKRNILVVPTLVGGASMPPRTDLPVELSGLASRQALEISDGRFRHDSGRLILALEKAVSMAGEPLQPDHGCPGGTARGKTSRQGAEGEFDVVIDPSAAVPHTAERGGYELVAIPGGAFPMGAPRDERERFGSEGPLREVTVAPFLLGKHPVTIEDYALFLKANPGVPEPETWADKNYNHPRQPAVCVSWEEAHAYCLWAGLRLPSEAEWEYACRAGTTTRFWSGDKEEDLARVGWFIKNWADVFPPHVGAKPANPFGLHDMHGTVEEWCSDHWHDTYRRAPSDGRAWVSRKSGNGYRVLRGGSCLNSARRARSAYRGRATPIYRAADFGFRPARSIAP